MHRTPQHNHRTRLMGPGAVLLGLFGLGVPIIAGVAWSQDAPPPGQKPDRQTATCSDDGCHTSIINRPFMHGPTAQQSCSECHDYLDSSLHLFKPPAANSDMCTSCHTLDLDRHMHTPVTTGDCTGCHDPHGSEHPLMLVADPNDGLCKTCHDMGESKTHVHGPVAVGACGLCHQPHSSSIPNLLTQQPQRLCLDCHSEMKPTGVAARRLHKPMEDGCTGCHDPHASDFRFQLEDEVRTLCLSCHPGVKSVLEEAVSIHGPTSEKAGCTTCHDPHFTELPRLQKKPQPELCLGCHSEEIKAADGRTLTNMAKLLEENPSHHGPIQSGDCTGCHQPHASGHFGLLLASYPKAFYAPYKEDNYSLCFTCHISDLVKDSSGEGLTGFRDGDLNLHWLHVNREKGRTCRACHEVHASSRPFHIRESVPYGTSGWMLELNFEQEESGGSCAPGCHKATNYDRASDRTANETERPAPAETNP